MADDADMPPERRHSARRALIWGGGIVAAIGLLAVLLVVGLDTGPGRAFLARQLAGFETESGLRFEIGRIDGSLYGEMQLVDVRVRDPDGVFVTIPSAAVEWRPLAWLNGLLDVRRLSAPDVAVARLPVLRPVPSEPDEPLLPDFDIMLGRISVERIALAPAITGKAHVVSLSGTADIAAGRAKIDADARALQAEGLAGGDRLALRVDAVPDENRLQIDGRVTAPVGGLIDSYAGLGRPLSLTIGGKGDWKVWDGAIRAQAGDAPLANLLLSARNGAFTAKGQVLPGAVLEGPSAHLFAPALGLDLGARIKDRTATLTLKAASDALFVEAAGGIDLERSRFVDMRVLAALLQPGTIAEDLRGRDVKLVATLDGVFSAPVVDYDARAAMIGFGETTVEGLAVSGRTAIEEGRILIPLNARASRVTGVNPAIGGLLTDLSINGDLALVDGRILSDNLHLRSRQINATALIMADPAKGVYTGAIKGGINDYRIEGLGSVRLTMDAELKPGAKGGFGIVGAARINTLSIENEGLRGVLGGNAAVTLGFGYDENGIATLRGLRLTAPRFRVTQGDGRYDMASGAISARVAATSVDYGPIGLTATGTLDRPRAVLVASRPGLGLDLRAVRAELVGTAAGYRVRATGESAYGPASANVLIQPAAPLTIDIASARLAGIDAQGRIAQTRAGPFGGTVSLSGSGLRGSAKLAAAGSDQQADIDMTANAARIPGDVPITIGSGTLRATAVMLAAGPSVNGRFSLGNVRRGEQIVTKASGRIAYAGGKGNVALVADGRAEVPFAIVGQAELNPDRAVANVRGTVGSLPFRLAAPAVLTRSGADWVLAPTRLLLSDGRAILSGRYGDAPQMNVRLEDLDLGIAQAFTPGMGLGGKASGTIDYAATSGAVPTLNARVNIAGFTRTSAYVVSRPMDIATLGTLNAEGGNLSVVVRRASTVLGRMQARLAPLGEGASLSERLFAAPLSGGIRYNGPSELLWTLTGIAGQTVSGPIAVAADFGGRLDQPTITGTMRANSMRYENGAYGTVISDIALDGRFTQSRLEIASLRGRAGNGTISGSGSVGLDAASGFPMDLAMELSRAQLARGDALGATVSGKLAITNSRAAGGQIRGDLRIPEARYKIIWQGASEVSDLEGVRRKTDPPADSSAAAPKPGLFTDWGIDIRIRADNQIFVSGMGLDAEWAADLRVRGTSGDPRITGSLDVVRGSYSFGGRRFDLDENGKVSFVGGPVLDPELELAASTTVEDVSATINIGGSAQHPEISFTSTPSLPQDEVLARLLFGESVTSLSPTQALQLAAALNSLRGGGGGLNPLGKLRSASGLDRLNILGADEKTGRGTALSAGQYISNDIFVEVITDTRGFTATQLEIALSKALSILSRSSSFSGSSVSLRYSKDY